MKIAYLVNQYPKVSHSFIRREIQALEKAGVSVARYSIRSLFDELVDPGDLNEHQKTKFVLGDGSLKKIVLGTLRCFFKPRLFFKTFSLAVSCGWGSERGLARHLIYFAEACVISRWCAEDEVQHIHAHFGTNSTTVAMLTGMLAGVPYSFTVHGPEEFDKPVFISLGKKIENSAFVVGISSFGKSQLYRQLQGRYWDKVNVVHCGLDSAFYEGGVTRAATDNNLVCVGRLCEQKGQLLLVEAAHKLALQGIDFHITLVGDGPMRSDVEELIRKYDLSAKLTITGWMSSDEVRQQLEAAKALVLPSFAEGLPVVIMESMALSRPVVTTYIAGIPELVIPGENGWLVPAGDVEALVDAVSSLLATPAADLDAMGASARRRVLERHNQDIEVAKLIPLFERSIATATQIRSVG